MKFLFKLIKRFIFSFLLFLIILCSFSLYKLIIPSLSGTQITASDFFKNELSEEKLGKLQSNIDSKIENLANKSKKGVLKSHE